MGKSVQISTSNELKSETYSIQNFINVIVDLEKKLQQISNEIKDNNWPQNKDSRMLFILFTRNLNLNTILLLSMLSDSTKNLQDVEWYKNKLPFFKRSIETNTNFVKFCNDRINNIFNHILSDFFLSYFFEFEARIRNIVRIMGNIKHPNPKIKKSINLTGNEVFYFVYKGLFNFLNIEIEQYNVLILFCAIRNTIHNSGINFNERDEDKIVTYRGIEYNLKSAIPINILTLELKKNILFDMLELFSIIIKNPEIQSVELIIDPVADIDFQ